MVYVPGGWGEKGSETDCRPCGRRAKAQNKLQKTLHSEVPSRPATPGNIGQENSGDGVSWAPSQLGEAGLDRYATILCTMVTLTGFFRLNDVTVRRKSAGADSLICEGILLPFGWLFVLQYSSTSSCDCAGTLVIHDNDAIRAACAFRHLECRRDRAIGKQPLSTAQCDRIDH